MKDNCVKTNLCREHNKPTKERLNALRMQVGVGVAVQYVAQLLINQNEAGRVTAQEMENHLTQAFADISFLRCNSRFIDEMSHHIADVLLSLWPTGEDTNAIHMRPMENCICTHCETLSA